MREWVCSWRHGLQLGLQRRHRVGAALQALEERAAEAEPLGFLRETVAGDTGEVY